MKAPPICRDFDAKLDTYLTQQRALAVHDPEDDYRLTWLRDRSGPNDWHVIAHYGNWDYVEPVVLQWIVSRQNCDAATALMIFWKASPDFYLETDQDRDELNNNQNTDYVSEALEHFDLIEYIRERWFGEGYQRKEYSFDYDRDLWPNEFEKLGQRFGEVARKFLPIEMRGPLPGILIKDVPSSEGWKEEWLG
ncbi:DUF4274 domain-containing protein [Sphingopyxis sp.]|uniref:DUF4274 domain-containing protein n=1 Tax=Sphingopyxis sp. TaxID=1908224 RepID=UPI002E119766